MIKRMTNPQMTNDTLNPKGTYFSDTYIYGTAIVWTNMAKLHIEDMEDI